MKLNQVIAVLQTVKANSTKAKTSVYHLIQKITMFQGISRTFQPVAEERHSSTQSISYLVLSYCSKLNLKIHVLHQPL